MSPDDEVRAAVALAEVDGLGPRRIAALVDATGSARAALGELAAGRLPPIHDPDGRIPFSAGLRGRLRGLRPVSAATLRDLEARGVRVVVRGGPGYPDRLGHLPDPPAVLWLSGPGELPRERAVAVVGTRRATEYGRRAARDLAIQLSGRGFAVVSGMATGIDAAAHRGALDVGGRTVGVLGSGLDRPYPRANARLYGRMRDAGLLASEFPPRTTARKGYFPRRNRIIAALAEAVVVVQAGKKSGALNTAGHALDLGREVLAVPGPIGTPGSVGVHGLLRDGANLATCAADVLRALGVEPEPAVPEPPGPAESDPHAAGGGPPPPATRGPREAARSASADEGTVRTVWTRLRAGPRPADELATAAGLPIGEALALLVRLELAGVLRALPGGRYERAGDEGREDEA